MFLPIEYLTRKRITRDWFSVPCSLFVFNDSKKMVVTVNEEFKPSDHFSVKHWQIQDCTPHQALPTFSEIRVPKLNVFRHKSVIIPGYQPVTYICAPIPSASNQYNYPMMQEIYNYYYDNYLDSDAHRQRKICWLWEVFSKIYIPDLCKVNSYILMFKSTLEIMMDQQNIVLKRRPKIWQYWEIWCKYMIADTFPGGFVFASDYRLTKT